MCLIVCECVCVSVSVCVCWNSNHHKKKKSPIHLREQKKSSVDPSTNEPGKRDSAHLGCATLPTGKLERTSKHRRTPTYVPTTPK